MQPHSFLQLHLSYVSICHDQTPTSSPLQLYTTLTTQTNQTSKPHHRLKMGSSSSDDDKHKNHKNHKHNHTDTGGALPPDIEHQKKPSRYSPEDTRGSISKVVVIILILIAITALVLWLLYRPSKPKFTVLGVSVVNINALTAFQITIANRNPNNRVSIYYNNLAIFILNNNNEHITPPLMLPPLHHKSDSTVVMKPMLPLSPEVVNGLGNGDNGSPVSLRVVLIGKRKWKYGGIKSGWKTVYVGCDLVIGFKRGVLGQVPLLGPSICHVDM